MMNKTVAEYSPSYSVLVMGEHERALATTSALLQEHAKIYQVFFYDEAVTLLAPVPKSALYYQQWLLLAGQYQLSLWLCHEALLNWGVLPEGSCQSAWPGFKLGSLGQFAEGCYHSDFLLSFGVQHD